jgi:hypothetical protein
MCQDFTIEMQKEFEMSMLGELPFFLLLYISQYGKGIFISQNKYIKEMLKKFRMEDCTPINSPMVTSCKLSKNAEYLKATQTLHRLMIGILLCVMKLRPLCKQ